MNKILNPKVWNSDETLKDKVYDDLLAIANHFILFAKINPSYVKDIIFVGSMANYNWHDKSDIDLHIVYDSSKFSDDQIELIQDYLLDKKAIWNFKHDIKIYGYDVEIYPEFDNMPSTNASVYSIKNHDWNIEPMYIDIDEQLELKKEEVEKKYNDYVTKIDFLIELSNNDNIDLNELSDKIITLKKDIWSLRKESLKGNDSIYSIGNLVFKALRNNDYLEKLINLETNVFDRNLTLEQNKILDESLQLPNIGSVEEIEKILDDIQIKYINHQLSTNEYYKQKKFWTRKLKLAEKEFHDDTVKYNNQFISEERIAMIPGFATRDKIGLHKNPLDLDKFDADIRGAIDYKGNLYVVDNWHMLHDQLYKYLIGVLSGYENNPKSMWYTYMPAGIKMLMIIRDGSTNTFRVADSYNTPDKLPKDMTLFNEQVEEFYKLTRLKNPQYKFIL